MVKRRPFLKKIFAIVICVGMLALPKTYAQSSPKSGRLERSGARTNLSLQQRANAVYVVKKGDSLCRVAQAHGTTVAALKAANGLKATRLSIGQRLILSPATNPQPGRLPDAAARKGQDGIADLPESPENALPHVQVNRNALQQAAVDESYSTGPQTDALADLEAELSAQPLRYRLASAGLEFLGVRYRRSGNSERHGFDCSGLVKCLFEKFNIGLPRSSREQFKEGELVEKDKLEVGDLVFFSSRGKTPTHVGIYIGDNQFLHAALRAKRVLISKLTAPWYNKRFLGARRLMSLWEADSQPESTDSR
jgi:cell wall-associated NlpC family hydrolase